MLRLILLLLFILAACGGFVDEKEKVTVKNKADRQSTEAQPIGLSTIHKFINYKTALESLPHRRRKRSNGCWYYFHTYDSTNPEFSIKCFNNTRQKSSSTSTPTTQNPGLKTDSVFTRLLKSLGYESYQGMVRTTSKPSKEEAEAGATPKSLVKKPTHARRKLTSAEIEQHKGKNKMKYMTSAEKNLIRNRKRKHLRKTKKRKRVKHGKDYPHTGGISASSVWSSVVDRKPTNRAPSNNPVPSTPIHPTRMTPKSSSDGTKTVSEWWNSFKWLFNTSIIITLPDGSHWYFPSATKEPKLSLVPITTAPAPPTFSSMTVTKDKQFVTTMKETVNLTLQPAKPTTNHRIYPNGKPEDGLNFPVFGVSDSPSHKWFPDQEVGPTYKWFADGVNPTESHKWFTNKKKGPKTEHKWFEHHTKKPVTSHSWFPDKERNDGKHTWFGEGDKTATDEKTYWWWGSTYRLILPEDDILDPQLLISVESILQKLLKIVKIDLLPN